MSRVANALGHDVGVTNLNADIRIPVGEIADPVKREKFLDVVRWVAEQLRAA